MTLSRRASTTLLWLPALGWAGVIFFLSAQSTLPPVGPELPFADKLNHFVAYALLGWFIILPLRRTHKLPLPKTIMLAILIVMIYGMTDEFHQYFVPNRSCDVGDWIADVAGAVAAAVIHIVYESLRRPKTNR